MSKIVLIDGHSILNRAFFGVPELTNSEGLHTNAIYGFLNIMFMIIEEEKPDYITVAFDVHKPTFRHEMYAEYKGTRSPMAEELREQVPVMQEVLKAMGIQVCTLPGYEADDVLGTIAKRCQANGMDVSLVSGDRDLLQISDEKICVRIPKTKGGKTQIENYYPKDVVDAYGVTPEVFIDMKALMGDSSDNIKGVHGVGPKSASKLLVQYGSIDGIYENIDSMKASAMKDNLINDKDSAYLSRKLVTILTDAPVDFDIEKAKIGNFYNEEAYAYFKRLEFKNFLSRFENQQSLIDLDQIEHSFIVKEDFGEVTEYFNKLFTNADKATTDNPFTVAVYIPAPPASERCDEISMVTLAINGDEIVTIPVGGFVTSDYLKDTLNKLAKTENIVLVTYKAKRLYRFLDLPLIEDKMFDVLIASYLIDPLKSEYDYEYISSLYLGTMVPGINEIIGKNISYSDLLANRDGCIKLSSYIVRTMILSYSILKDELDKAGMFSLFKDIEMPLTRVLSSMESLGIRVNPHTLSDYSVMLGKRMEELSSSIYEKAGEEFNILSPKQLGTILFEKMNLPGAKKTKTGYSTSADVLEKLSYIPLVADILEYRAVSKLKSTYADGLSAYIDENNRIHSTFHQTITATGRISSADPNLQNIPTRTELGRGLRAAFIPSEGYVFTDADYSQIELRILAHIANDKGLLEAYAEGSDIHRITASKVFGVPLEKVTDTERRNAKAVNFGIVYGISSFGLSQDLDITRKQAAEYIDQYFVTFPGIKKYLDDSVEKAKLDGYVTTLYGRRRPIPELSSSNFMQRSFGERVAMNSPIQGTAADIMKIAMINVYRRLEALNLKSRMVLQIHDEIIVETAPDEKEVVNSIVTEEMMNAANLHVSLEIDLHNGTNWLEAK